MIANPKLAVNKDLNYDDLNAGSVDQNDRALLGSLLTRDAKKLEEI